MLPAPLYAYHVKATSASLSSLLSLVLRLVVHTLDLSGPGTWKLSVEVDGGENNLCTILFWEVLNLGLRTQIWEESSPFIDRASM